MQARSTEIVRDASMAGPDPWKHGGHNVAVCTTLGSVGIGSRQKAGIPRFPPARRMSIARRRDRVRMRLLQWHEMQACVCDIWALCG